MANATTETTELTHLHFQLKASKDALAAKDKELATLRETLAQVEEWCDDNVPLANADWDELSAILNAAKEEG